MNHYIHILTDSNRSCLHVGITDNLQHVARTPREPNSLMLDGASNASRLVYHEVYSDEMKALKRLNELSRYTRMQKERLIRRRNPNWLNLGSDPIPARVARTAPQPPTHTTN